MRLVLQRVTQASVAIQGKIIASIGRGLVIFLCIEKGDDSGVVERYAAKVTELRIFEDAQGKMNLSIRETGGEILLVSQFTLAADAEKGRRPSFDRAAAPEIAQPLYEYFAKRLGESGVRVSLGVFQAMMQVQLINDGPVTILLGKFA